MVVQFGREMAKNTLSETIKPAMQSAFAEGLDSDIIQIEEIEGFDVQSQVLSYTKQLQAPNNT